MRALACDVSDGAAVQAAVDTLRKYCATLDGLINNAGVIEPIAELQDSDLDAWRRLIEINVNGVYHGIRAALPVMRLQGRGTIITLSSGAAHNPLVGWSACSASKAAVAMLSRVADLESRQHGIRVMGLAPGTIATDMQAAIRGSGVNRISGMDWWDHGKPEWVGRVQAWMCSPDADDRLGQEVSLRDPDVMGRAGPTG